jgi:hypothetical protein
LHRKKGFVHRLDKETISYYFTNFPEDAKVSQLWSKFARFGRIGEVYIPKKLDKQGRRFGFVKFRDVRDAWELLSRMDDIWMGTYKLRINLSRFNKGEVRKEEEATTILRSNRTEEARCQQGRSFREAVVSTKDKTNVTTVAVSSPEQDKMDTDIVWEVEVEAEVLAKLKGAYVGFLVEHKDYSEIQRNFTLDGYHNITVSPLGHLMVLLSSTVAGEVKEVVQTVGWWCTWFDRFEEWSPDLVSSQRTTWLKCYGVPHHAWGGALFRAVAFKFGRFVEVDLPTKNMERWDMARIKIVTENTRTIDASMFVSVMEKKFTIRVMEEGGVVAEGGLKCCGGCKGRGDGESSRGSVDGGSVMAVVQGSVEVGSDGDWSDNGQFLVGEGGQGSGKGLRHGTRLEREHAKGVSELDPNTLGNTLATVSHEVNHGTEPCLAVSEGCKDIAVEAGGMLGNGSKDACVSNRTGGGVTKLVGPGKGNESGGAKSGCFRPTHLRTKDGDRPLLGPIFQTRAAVSEEGGVVHNSVSLGCVALSSPCDLHLTMEFSGSFMSSAVGTTKQPNTLPGTTVEHCRKPKSKRKQIAPHPGCKFLNFQEYIQRKGKAMMRKKTNKRRRKTGPNPPTCESDPIESSGMRSVNEVASSVNSQQDGSMEGIQLEVVLPVMGGLMGANGMPDVVVNNHTRGSGGSGVVELSVNDQSNNSKSSCSEDRRVDRDSCEAYHIIDIQDDLGMNFNGQKEAVATRLIAFEERDRCEKSDWEQKMGDQ